MLDKAGAAQHGQRLVVPSDRAFLLYDSYGFPLEITAEIAAEVGVGVDTSAFDAAMQAQRQRSKDSVKVWAGTGPVSTAAPPPSFLQTDR